MSKLGDCTEIAARFLDGTYVRISLCNFHHSLRLNCRACSGRNIVDDAGKLCGLRDCRVVGDQTALCCLIVIRGDKKKSVRAELFGLFRHHYRMGCIVGTGSRNDRNTALYDLNSKLDDFEMLVVIECRSFP